MLWYYNICDVANIYDIANENNKDHNKAWSYIPDHPNRMLIIRDFGSWKTNALLSLIKAQDSDKILSTRFVCMLKT